MVCCGGTENDGLQVEMIVADAQDLRNAISTLMLLRDGLLARVFEQTETTLDNFFGQQLTKEEFSKQLKEKIFAMNDLFPADLYKALQVNGYICKVGEVIKQMHDDEKVIIFNLMCKGLLDRIYDQTKAILNNFFGQQLTKEEFSKLQEDIFCPSESFPYNIYEVLQGKGYIDENGEVVKMI